MSLSENLQNLRKIKNMSQEELAEKLNVSRQAVSKWESENGYPETEKIISICEIFDCSMDDLVKGKITEDVNKEKSTYDGIFTKAAKGIATGVGSILLGVSILLTLIGLVSDGAAQERMALIGVVCILVAVTFAVSIFIINGSKMDSFKKKNPKIANIYSEEETEKAKDKYTKYLVIGIATVLLGVIALISLVAINVFGDESPIPAAILMYFITIGVSTIVYSGMMKSKYDIETYNKENTDEYKEKDEKKGRICGSIMLLATIAFFIWGFVFSGWAISWIVFPIGGMLCGIVGAITGNSK